MNLNSFLHVDLISILNVWLIEFSPICRMKGVKSELFLKSIVNVLLIKFSPICGMKGVESFRDFPQTFDGLIAICANVKTNLHLLRRFNLNLKKNQVFFYSYFVIIVNEIGFFYQILTSAKFELVTVRLFKNLSTQSHAIICLS